MAHSQSPNPHGSVIAANNEKPEALARSGLQNSQRKILSTMTLHTTNRRGKHYRTARPQISEPNIHPVRYILDRWDVSPSLARTICALALLGGR